MQKNTMFKILNPILAVLTVTQTLSALLADHLSYVIFEWLHKGGGFLLLAGIGLHIGLNWSWVRANLLPRRHG